MAKTFTIHHSDASTWIVINDNNSFNSILFSINSKGMKRKVCFLL